MKLKEVAPEEMNIKLCSRQEMVREILNQFKESNMKCAEIENWEEISDTLENFRTMVRNQISYRNGKLYKGIRIVTRTGNGYKAFLIREGENK